MKSIIIIFYLLKLKKNLFFNSLKKVDTWVKIVSVVFLLILFLTSIRSSAFISKIFKGNFSLDNEYYNSIFNVILFSIFIFNIIFVFFMGKADDYLANISALLRYPISVKQIVFFNIISIYGEVFNILFFPFYISVYFFMGNKFFASNFLFFSIIFILFTFFVNNLIYLFKNTVNLFLFSKKTKFIIYMFLVLMIFIVSIFSSKQLSNLLSQNNIIRLSSYLIYTPTSIFESFVKNFGANIFIYGFVKVLVYFTLINSLFFVLNLSLVKKLSFYKERISKSNSRKQLNKSRLSFSVLTNKFNPIFRKNIQYFFRSFYMTINATTVIFGILFIIFPAFSHRSAVINSAKILNLLIITFISEQTFIILILGFNSFGQDYSAVINYFFRPIALQDVIVAKIFMPVILFISSFLINAIVLVYFNISALNFLLYIIFSFMSIIFSSLISSVISIYFPKKIPFYEIHGRGGSSIASITFFIFLILFIGLQFLIFSISDFPTKIFITTVLVLISVSIIYYRKKILIILSKYLNKRKERVISACQ